MPNVADLYRTTTTLPILGPLVGERLFSLAFAQKAQLLQAACSVSVSCLWPTGL